MPSRPFDYRRDEDFEALPTESVNEVVPGLVNLAGWMKEPVRVPAGCTYLAWKIEDDPDAEPGEVALRSLARFLAERVSSGATVAVYCAGGLNRSGLVVGHTLVALGRSGEEAVESVRAARGKWALSNPRFEASVRSARPTT
jgi:protein-tyrosine phosphatase